MKIYLAGFDVFREDAAAEGNRMKMLCEHYGFTGLFPLDNECSGAEEIFSANMAMIASCDVVAANMNSFRGAEPDSGTAFEVGAAYAMGKKVFCYRQDGRTLREQLGEADAQGYAVEDFGYPLNLMIACSSRIVIGTLEDCLLLLREECGGKEE